jgi:hypothetical protein
MSKALIIVLFMLLGLFIAILAVMAFLAVRVQHYVGSDTSNVNVNATATAVAKDIGTFTVPSGFIEQNRRFKLSLSPDAHGESTAAVFVRTDNRNVIMTLVSRPSDTAPGLINVRAAFVKRASRFCVRSAILSDDRAIVYGKPLSLHKMSCVLRSHVVNILEGASFAKMRSAGNAENIIIAVFASGPKSKWDPKPLHALLASLR